MLWFSKLTDFFIFSNPAYILLTDLNFQIRILQGGINDYGLVQTQCYGLVDKALFGYRLDFMILE